MGFVVDELFAFIAVDDDGDEGVMAAIMGDTMMPLIFADLTRLPAFAPIADNIAKAAGMDYTLKHFQLLGDVSDEYLGQYKTIQEPSLPPDDSGDTGEDEREPDDPGGSSGGREKLH